MSDEHNSDDWIKCGPAILVSRNLLARCAHPYDLHTDEDVVRELRHLANAIEKGGYEDPDAECPDCRAYSDKGIAPRCGEHASDGIR